MAAPTIEIRALGPNAKAYLDLGKQLHDELAEEGVRVQVVLLFSEQITTTVFVGIGIGVIVQVLSKVLDRLLNLRTKEKESKTEISVRVEIRNKIYLLPEDRDILLDEYSEE